MAFSADFNGGTCPECRQEIRKGDLINYSTRGNRRAPVHVDCEVAEEDTAEAIVDWMTHLDHATATIEDVNQEYKDLQPLQRPVCPTCWLELPKSLVCGSC